MSLRFRHSITTLLVAAVASMALPARWARSTECNPLMLATRADMDQTISLAGRTRTKLPLRLKARSSLLLLSQESGVDAYMELRNDAGQVLARADSPVRRTGIQRIYQSGANPGSYSIELISKGDPQTSGSLRVRAIASNLATADPRCLGAQRLLALADIAYAAGLAGSHQLAEVVANTNAAEQFSAAVSDYRQAGAFLESASSPLLMAQSLHSASAVLNQDIEDYKLANDLALRAAAQYLVARDDYGAARARAIGEAARMEVAMTLSNVKDKTGHSAMNDALRDARGAMEQLAHWHHLRGEAFDEALALNNIGLTYWYEDRNDAAIAAYQRALPLYVVLRERSRQSQVHANIALAHYEMGRFPESIAENSQALLLIDADRNPKYYANTLNNRSLSEIELGRLDAALRDLNQALDLARSLQNDVFASRSLEDIGCIYDAAGDTDQALTYFKEALSMMPAASDPQGRVSTLRQLSTLLLMRGEVREALGYDREALQLAASPSIRVRIHIQISRELELLGDHVGANDQLDSTLKERGIDTVSRTMLLVRQIELNRDRIGAQARLGILLRAASTYHDYELTRGEFDTWLQIARLQRARDDLPAALSALDRALALADDIRRQSANPLIRGTLMQPLRPAFDLKISILAQQHFSMDPADNGGRELLARSALDVAEASRARALADLGAEDLTAANLPPRLLRERRKLLDTLAGQHSQLESRIDSGGVNASMVQALRSSIAESRRRLLEIDATIGRLSTSDDSTKERSLTTSSVSVPPGTGVIEYWLGEEQALAWSLRGGRVTLTKLAGTKQIQSAVSRLREVMQPGSNFTDGQRHQAAAMLYGLVLAPVQRTVTDSQRLIFAPDDVLHYVPFAILRSASGSGGKFLIEDHDVANTPSISQMFSSERRPTGTTHASVLLVADPVYERDPRRPTSDTNPQQGSSDQSRLILRSAVDQSDLARLPGTELEATLMRELVRGRPVDRLQGFDATRDRFLRANLAQYQYIHVAAHGVLDTNSPDLSALILSTRDSADRSIDGRITMADLLGVTLTADIVVLSACNTALGKNVAGEGLMGLQYALLGRGANAVMASLWPIPDRRSAQLIGEFYAQLLRRSRSPEAALGTAMRQMIASGLDDPSRWGSFVVVISRNQ